MFSQACVKISVHKGIERCTPPGQTPRADTPCVDPPGNTPPQMPDGHCSRWYISYWNAFLFLPAATKLGQGNIFRSMCQEFCPQGKGGVSASVHAGIHPPPGADPPRPDHPPEQTPPGADTPPPGRSRLRHTVNERPVRILLECILVLQTFTACKVCEGSQVTCLPLHGGGGGSASGGGVGQTPSIG